MARIYQVLWVLAIACNLRVCGFGLGSGAGFGLGSGPFDVKYYEGKQCADQGTKKWIFPTDLVHNADGTTDIQGTFYLRVPVDQNFKFILKVFKIDGKRRTHFADQTVRSCESLKHLMPDEFKLFFDHIGVSRIACPLANGTYTLQPIPLSKIIIPVPILPYGNFTGTATAFYKREKVGCIEGLVGIVPKK